MSLVEAFATSFVVAFSGAIMPGPLLTATISESAQRGAVAGPILVIGHSLLELAMLVAILAGVKKFLGMDGVFVGISLSGATVLLAMAVGMFRSLPSLSLDFEPKERVGGRLVVRGAAMSIANPYWTIWWATIGVFYVALNLERSVFAVAAFYLGHISGDLVWYSAVSIGVAKGRRLLTDRLYRWVVGVCAGVLAIFAFIFVHAGIRRLLT